MLFDAYLIVDWSANSTPKRGKDSSIWLAYHENGTRTVENISTRWAARTRVADLLRDAVGRSKRVLVGFDFPYSYPTGFARALGLSGEPWRAVWCELTSLIDDRPDNSNNRWQVAATNKRLGAGSGSFWNVPPTHACSELTVRKPAFPCAGLNEYRLVEQRLRDYGRGAHSAWKLFTAGSVGSQTLLGIPVVESLRSDPALAAVSRVWPFETRFSATPSPERGPFVLHAEVWPGAFPVDHSLHEIKDAAQVQCLVERFAREDVAGGLGRWFQVDAAHDVVLEEGWILGV
jgi:precorrin-8X/cobalt-precorrin-8 methylmutase